MTNSFTINDLMTLLTQEAGLPVTDHVTDPSAAFADVGLDSLAFLALQTVLEEDYGVDLGDDGPQHYTFGEILEIINRHLSQADLAHAS